MPSSHLLRTLIPETPLHKRTEKDIYPDAATELRTKFVSVLRPRALGISSPSLTSSYAGSIDTIMFAFPRYAVNAALAGGYKSVIAALRPGTAFVVVHAKSVRPEIDRVVRRGADIQPTRLPLLRYRITSISPTGQKTVTYRLPIAPRVRPSSWSHGNFRGPVTR